MVLLSGSSVHDNQIFRSLRWSVSMTDPPVACRPLGAWLWAGPLSLVQEMGPDMDLRTLAALIHKTFEATG